MNGSHVYLNKSLVLFKYLKRNKFIGEDINNIGDLRELDDQEKKYNQKRCIEIFDKEVQQEKVKE